MTTFDQDVAYITQEMSDLTEEITELQNNIGDGLVPAALQDQAWRTIRTMWNHVAHLQDQITEMEAKENGTDTTEEAQGKFAEAA